MIVSDQSTGGGKLCPEGTHIARCFQVVDMGEQPSKLYGSKHQLMLRWELPEELEVFKEGEDPKPFAISKRYTASLNEKSNLCGDLQNWRGKPFTEEELKGFDIAKLIGQPCMLTIMHKESGGKTYANVTAVAKPPRSLTCPPQINESLNFECKDGYSASFKKLPDWLQKLIEVTPQFKAAITTEEYGEEPHGNSSLGTPEDEDIPFSPNYL